MGIFDDNFGNNEPHEGPNVPQHEHFPSDTYGPAYAVSIYQEDLRALKELVEAESSSSTSIEQTAFLKDAIDDELRLRKSGDELSPFVRDLIETWESQMDAEPSAVWWPVASDWRLKSYLHYCELRDEQDEDGFEFTEGIGRVHALFSRCKAAQENDSKLAIVPKEEIPGEEPAVTDSST
ncbi:hypothetical protein [Natronorubrum daqingense]|uniref:Uncharacterized protein n=1 Tax=Natronorubrum daqingense TaxID=588898 RepID=A0A1N6ZDQ3_9EURY|nr:hypothetical protein [Natronorubrum daqingense]APX95381.1 hypothetical protein BB347_01440 [Natronorubrum daqingense]SIR24955.1 hypothetical protein SAMN05421809_0770 [Natronorubrum daqingense]